MLTLIDEWKEGRMDKQTWNLKIEGGLAIVEIIWFCLICRHGRRSCARITYNLFQIQTAATRIKLVESLCFEH